MRPDPNANADDPQTGGPGAISERRACLTPVLARARLAGVLADPEITSLPSAAPTRCRLTRHHAGRRVASGGTLLVRLNAWLRSSVRNKSWWRWWRSSPGRTAIGFVAERSPASRPVSWTCRRMCSYGRCRPTSHSTAVPRLRRGGGSRTAADKSHWSRTRSFSAVCWPTASWPRTRTAWSCRSPLTVARQPPLQGRRLRRTPGARRALAVHGFVRPPRSLHHGRDVDRLRRGVRARLACGGSHGRRPMTRPRPVCPLA